MKKFLLGTAVLLGIGIIAAVMIGSYVLSLYNGLQTQNQMVATSWSQVETQYQRRFDLIPNLVNATKGVLTQEQKVFGDIANARTHYANSAPGSADRVDATSQYDGALSRLLVVMENYPVLKSYDTVKGLTDELAGTENRVQVARDRYNEQVRIFNTTIVKFPSNIIAGMLGFQPKEYFKADDSAQAAPTVDLTT